MNATLGRSNGDKWAPRPTLSVDKARADTRVTADGDCNATKDARPVVSRCVSEDTRLVVWCVRAGQTVNREWGERENTLRECSKNTENKLGKQVNRRMTRTAESLTSLG